MGAVSGDAKLGGHVVLELALAVVARLVVDADAVGIAGAELLALLKGLS